MKRLILAAAVLLTACNPVYLGAAALLLPLWTQSQHKPGDTLTLVSASEAAIAIEYTHSYSDEYGAAYRRADKECQRYRRHATAGRITQVSLDRSVATFPCRA